MNTTLITRAAVGLSVAALVVLSACQKKAGSGQACSKKEDCADGLDCYVIGINIVCLDTEKATVMCKASNLCKTYNKCTPTVEHGMGGCK
jgi:hypothetical protein